MLRPLSVLGLAIGLAGVLRAQSPSEDGPRHDPTDPADFSRVPGGFSVRLRTFAGDVPGRLIADGQEYPIALQFTDGRTAVWRALLPESVRSYHFQYSSRPLVNILPGGRLSDSLFRAVPWVGGAIGYQVFPERFANGDRSNDSLALRTDEYEFWDPARRGARPTLARWTAQPGESHCCHQYFGGDLQGIRDHLAHLDSLGVTLLYLNPIWSSGSAHGYDTWDYLAVEPSFGDERVLRALLDEAKARGMRVIWDFVPNHVGVGNAQFRDAITRGAASPYWDWFTFKVPAAEVRPGNGDHYATFVGIGAMPKLNTANPAVRAYLMRAVEKWTRFGFSGIRVDVPWEVDAPGAFWPQLWRTAKGIDRDQYLVGEMWQRAPDWLRPGRFDAVMNYAVGQDVLEKWVTGAIDGDSAVAAMVRVYASYPEASVAMAFNVIATHDNARLLTKMGGGDLFGGASEEARARARLASAMLYALPGVPVTFQGDECGFLGTGGGGSGERNRYPMQWDRCDARTFEHYRALAVLRRAAPALTSPAIRLPRAAGSVLAWLRGEPLAGEALVAFNRDASAVEFALPDGDWTDLATGEVARGSLTLAGHGWRYLTRR